MDATQAGLEIGPEEQVNEVVRVHPATVGVFNRFGIDACCGGAAPIREAAIRDGADPEAPLTAINEVVGGRA